jgi:hypothetical protein
MFFSTTHNNTKKHMKKNTISTLCIFASIGSILAGVALMFAALSPKRPAKWGEVTIGFTPEAILIAGGLIALAICGSYNRDSGGSD